MSQRSHVTNTPATGFQILKYRDLAERLLGDTTLETQTLIANAKKVRDYCFRNRQALVMQAVETLFGTER